MATAKKKTTSTKTPAKRTTKKAAKPKAAKPKAAAAAPKAERSLTDKQLAVLQYLNKRRATTATKAVPRKDVWDNAGSGTVCGGLRDKGLVDRSDMEDVGLCLFLTKAGVAALKAS